MIRRRTILLSSLGLAVLVGLAVGLGLYTFAYARGYSYLLDDPSACANCHVMEEQYSGWIKSSHRAVAGCNDCHTPHDTVGKYMVKAKNGFWHSYYFTTGTFKEPIRITKDNREVTEATCRHCHGDLVHAMDAGAGGREPLSCIRCHGSVGHPSR
ncbi:cytochrome c nitrite reductase small subunit [Vulgatibacter sp.]|uniref:cytochrome c nitrite reductase small subunit n=1 Tax=Vulgatibacter sp. TaxID=1971226 RepID=UPI0035678E12